ncbi:uncharacterized protein TNCV_5057751 [Trichonephila clavipes]|nr:uncharacterized protein TNCV_5057751 [Trichonephila clavipes]
MQTYKLDPCWYFTTPALSWDAMLLHTKVAIELFTDYDMLLFIEKGVRGDESDVGYILEVDLEYPSDLHDKHSDFPLAPENKPPPNSVEKKTIQLAPSARKPKPMQEKNNSTLVSRNETTQLNRRKQLNSEKTTQLVSRNETTQLCTAVNRLQPPATAYDRLQPPTTADRLQPPAPPAPPLQQNRLFLPTIVVLLQFKVLYL